MDRIKQVNPWWLLGCAVLILAYNMGIRQSVSLMVPQMSAGLSIPVSEISLGFAVQNLVWGAVAPIAGLLAERFGTARVLLAGITVYGIGLLVASAADSGLLFFVGNALLIGIGAGATTFPIILAVVGKRFPAHRRSLALGIATAGGSLGQFGFALFVGKLAPVAGWSGTYMWCAVTSIAALLLVFGFVGSRNDPESHSASASASLTLAPDPALSKALSLRRIFDWSMIGGAFNVREYQLLNIGFFVCGFHIAFITVHMSGLVAYCGLLPAVASDSLAIIGLMNVVGVILIGWAGDKWHKPWLLVLVYWLRASLLIALLLLPKTETIFYLFSGLVGMLWLSTVPLTSGSVAQIFGTKNLASLFGIVMLSHQIGAFFGSWWAGLTFEWFGSYDLAIIVSALLGLLAAAVHLPMTPIRMARFSPA